jgi:predicted DNA-binding transcriptional regulator YafY
MGSAPAAPTRHGRSMRPMQVLALIASHPVGLTTGEIARRLDVSTRTVQRDLLYLQSAEFHAPLVLTGRRWQVPPGYSLPPIAFDLQEATALLIGARLMARYADKANPFAVSAYQKLAAVLPTEAKQAVADVADELQALPLDTTFARVLGDLVLAWAERRQVIVTYTLQSAFERRLWPLVLEPNPNGHTCYLVAWDPKAGDARNYRIERISRVQVLDERFSTPLGFSLSRHLAHAWTIWSSSSRPVRVEVEFEPSIAERVRESRWHHSQQLEQRPDGSLRARFLVADTREIRPWILGWGAACRVIRPASLRAEIVEEAEAIVRASASALGGPGLRVGTGVETIPKAG